MFFLVKICNFSVSNEYSNCRTDGFVIFLKVRLKCVLIGCILLFFSKIWNAESGDEILSLPHKHIVKSVDFSKDSSQLLTGSNEKLLRVYDLNTPESGK